MARATMPPVTGAQVDRLFVEWRNALSRYFETMWRNYYWPQGLEERNDDMTAEQIADWLARERQRRGEENHRLHVAAYEAGEIARGAIRSFTGTVIETPS